MTNRDGSYYLTDASGAVKAAIGDILIFTADERNNTLGTLTHDADGIDRIFIQQIVRVDMHDVYKFVPSTSKTYTITTTSSSGADLDCKIYDAYGSYFAQSVAAGQVNITLTLQAGKTYYFDVYNYSNTATDYTITIS